MYQLTQLLRDAGVTDPGDFAEAAGSIYCLETVERCRQCKKGFKSRYGYIYSCKNHEFLEEVHIGPVFATLKKKKKEK